MQSIALKLTVSLFPGLGLCSAADAQQCALEWSSGSPQPALTGNGICSTTWDPDGAGPLPELLVVGGSGLRGGHEPLDQRTMTWDGTTWGLLGNGPGTAGAVRALAVWNGQLVAAGDFTGGGTDLLAQWNGSAWQALGGGFRRVTAITVWNGDLVAAGTTTGSSAPFIQRWNGVAWTPLPAPPLLQAVGAITSFQGLLCVGGVRVSSPAGGVIERWTGSSWLPSTTAPTGAISCFAVRGSSTLYAGGSFLIIGGVAAARIAATTGGSAFAWHPVGGGLPATCRALHVRTDPTLGTVIVACLASTSTPVQQFSGGTSAPMGSLTLSSVSFYAGAYHGATDEISGACQRWDPTPGAGWRPVLGPGIAGEVRALALHGNDVILGGSFATISGVVAMRNVARWDGSSFHPLGTGLGHLGHVDALLTLDNGEILAGGHTFQGGQGFMARWNGSAWLPVGFPFLVPGGSGVFAMCRMPNGDAVVGGTFNVLNGIPCFSIARGDGSQFVEVGSGIGRGSITISAVLAMAARNDGMLFAGGAFSQAGSVSCDNIAQWDGVAWQPLGAGCNGPVRGLTVLPNGDVVAVGDFTTAGGIPVDRCARWNGSTWAPMNAQSGDPTPVHAVLALPNGDVIAGRGFHEPAASPDSGIARWNGSAWSGLDGGMQGTHAAPAVSVRAMALRPDGELWVGGSFGVAGGASAYSLASLSPTCPALAQPYGAGCSSAAGPLVLTADTLPWMGQQFRTTTTGIAAVSLCFDAIGFTQLSTPLGQLHPSGQPGCSLLASPDSVTLRLPVGNRIESSLALPPISALIGATFFQQTIVVEIIPSAIRGSNGLAATIGTL